jgi:hypothetical protein
MSARPALRAGRARDAGTTSGAKGGAKRADMINESRRVAFRQGYREEVRSALIRLRRYFTMRTC